MITPSRINIIEAPTKEECLELFKEVTRTRRDSKLDEAIR